MYDLAHAYKMWPVPARFQTCTPAHWAAAGVPDYPDEWRTTRGWLAGFRRYLSESPDVRLRGHGLALVGETGVGKSMLAASMLNYLRAKGFSVAWVTDGDLGHLLSVKFISDMELDLLAILERAACTVVDDLGRTPGAIEYIEPFLRRRMDAGKPSVITMNNEVPLPATLESLLHEFSFVTFTGVDRRKSPLEPHHGRW